MRVFKRLLFALMLLPLALKADGIITDWRGATGVASASTCSGTPCTLIVTNELHGLYNNANVGIIGGTGTWNRINTQQNAIYIKQAWDKSASTVIVSDTTRIEGTPGATWTITGASNAASGCPANGSESILMGSVIDSRTVSFSKRGTTAYNHCPEDQLIGPINRNDGHGAVPASWRITIVSPTSYTIPLNSSTFGVFTGNLRITHGSSTSGQLFSSYTGDGSPNGLNVTLNHTAAWVIDSCDINNVKYCGNTYTDPMNQFGYGSWGTVLNLVVSGGTGSITFSSALVTSGISTLPYPLAAGTVVWLWGWNEPTGLPWGTINRMWPIASVTGTGGTGTIVTFANMGIPDGTYTVQKTTKQLYLPLSGEQYVYFNSGATDNNYPFEWPSTMVQTNGDPTNPLFNRLRSWWYTGASFKTQIVMSDFVRTGAIVGGGFKGYHALNLDFFANAWMLYENTTWPDHEESASNPWIPPGADAIWTGSAGYQAQKITQNVVHYIQGTRIYYINITSLAGLIPPQTSAMGPITYTQITGEPEEWTSDRAAVYDGTAFHIYVRAATQRTGQTAKFNFYHSPTSLRAAGSIAGGTLAASNVAAVTTYNGYSTYQAQITSVSLPLTESFWDIQPIMNVAGVSGVGQNPVIISYLADPNLSIGNTVTTAGVGGNLAANSTTSVQAVYPRQFLYRAVPGIVTPPVSGPLTSITVQNGGAYPTCTVAVCSCTANLAINTSTLHIWQGSTIAISGSPAGGPGSNPPGAGNTETLTFFNVIAVANTSFDFSCPNQYGTNPLTPGTYNTDYSSTIPMVLIIEPAIAVAANGTPAAWDGKFAGTSISPQSFAEINYSIPSYFLPPTNLAVTSLN